MKIAVPKETERLETRVAATPETVRKFESLGLSVFVQRGAGEAAHFSDADYEAAGATLVEGAEDLYADADLVLKVRPPAKSHIAKMKPGAVLVAMLNPTENPDLAAYAKAGVVACAMELMPRITRAQSMDVLSSQSNLAGYKAVIDAAAQFGRALPMMMTAAGTIAPAKVFVMGAGVAGLQAIATARRLGAVVSATDVRMAAKEQVESLGATFVMVDSDEMREAETKAGYAKEMSEDFKRAQAALVAEHIKKQDIVVTTALIPGRPAPELISAEMVADMKPGSIIIDLAAERGGNCALTAPGETVDAGGVTIMGPLNLAGRLAADASSLYARNLFNFVSPLYDKDAGRLKLDWDDEIVKGVALTRDGAIVHPAVAAAAPAPSIVEAAAAENDDAPESEAETGEAE
ncbi:MAG: Re/Si-specific NAD(P)(+) transhydrogenase subunit alpha [Parvularculaceae bacterium]